MIDKNKYSLLTEKEKVSSLQIESKYLVDVFICATVVSMMIIRSISRGWVFVFCMIGVFYCLFKANELKEVCSLAESFKNGAKVEFKMNGELIKDEKFLVNFKSNLNGIAIEEVEKDIKGFMIRGYVLSMVASVPVMLLVHDLFF